MTAPHTPRIKHCVPPDFGHTLHRLECSCGTRSAWSVSRDAAVLASTRHRWEFHLNAVAA